MPRVVFRHSVSVRALWAPKHAERFAAFAAWCSNVTGHLSADGGNNVAVSVDVHDMAPMQAALSCPDLAAAKQAHGVIEPVHVLVAAGSSGEAA